MAQGDYVPASEKFWGAAAEMVKAIAARKGIDLPSDSALYRFITSLSKELNDPELLRLLGLASALHQNFYENWLSAEMVVDYGEAVTDLVTRLAKIP